MTAPPIERWLRVKELVNEVLELPKEERAAFLERACDGDWDLHREVAALIAREARLGDFLNRPFFTFRDDDHDLDIGRELGSYRLVRRIGSGGMGTVYLAERVDGEVSQELAVKVLKRGLDTEEIVRRFQRERQILADLSHPYIARLLDVGTAPDGRPFFALEHVEGERIDTYCDARGLDVHQRVALLRRVCAAVHFAHQNLVVHRDLKPANILVAAEGAPKLLDFGIAKLLDRETQGTVVTTQPGSAPMSLPYASPEQLAGGPITTATDVYGLGVVLYELLTGRRPHRLDDLGLEEAARRLREETPSRPSAAVDERGGESRLPARRLRGDLDNIVLKALAIEPERRYASAEQLSEDLRRHLEGLPVGARPDTFSYRAGKFARRHPAWVVAGALVAILVLGLALALGAAITNERNRAKQERVANWVTDFLVHLPEFVDPAREHGETLTLLEALDGGARQLDRDFEDQPEVRAALLDALGSSYRRLANYEEARRLLEEALEQRRLLFGEDHFLVAETMHNLANVEADDRNREKAEKLMRRSLEIQRQHFPDGHRDLARGLNNLAILLTGAAPEEAESLARESLAMAEDLFGLDQKQVTGPLNTLGQVLRTRGKSREAEDYLRRCLVLRRAQEEPSSPRLGNVLNILGGALSDQGRLAEATPLYQEALVIRRKIHPEGHPDLVTILNNFGRNLFLLGQPEEAEKILQEAYDTQLRMNPESERKVAMLARSLAWALLGTEAFVECQELARSAHDYFEQHGARRYLAESKSVLGGCLAGQGQFEEAELLLQEGYEGLVEILGEDDPLARMAWEQLGHSGGGVAAVILSTESG